MDLVAGNMIFVRRNVRVIFSSVFICWSTQIRHWRIKRLSRLTTLTEVIGISRTRRRWRFPNWEELLAIGADYEAMRADNELLKAQIAQINELLMGEHQLVASQ